MNARLNKYLKINWCNLSNIWPFHRFRKAFGKNNTHSWFIFLKVSKLGIEGNFPSLMKDNYQRPNIKKKTTQKNKNKKATKKT